MRKLVFHIAALTLLLGVAAAGTQARAQNLVINPNFANGLQDYTTTGNVGLINIGGNAAFFGSAGDTISQSIETNPGTLYMISFIAAFDPGVADSALASFGNGSLPISFSSGSATGQPAPYSFTGTADGSATTLGFTNQTGESYITTFDVEPAPAPVPGTGGLSILASLGGISWFAVRRKRSARRISA